VIGQPEKGPAPAAAGLKAVVQKEAGNIEDEKAEPAQRIEAVPVAKLPKPSPAAPKPRLITSQSNPIGNVAQIMADILPQTGRNCGPVRGLFEGVRGGRQAAHRSGRLPGRPRRVVQNAQHQDRSNGYRRVFAESQALSHNRERQRLTSRQLCGKGKQHFGGCILM
jgi:hypothetical protein